MTVTRYFPRSFQPRVSQIILSFFARFLSTEAGNNPIQACNTTMMTRRTETEAPAIANFLKDEYEGKSLEIGLSGSVKIITVRIPVDTYPITPQLASACPLKDITENKKSGKPKQSSNALLSSFLRNSAAIATKIDATTEIKNRGEMVIICANW